jgi:phospholipase/carboxylesterase
MTAPAVDPDRIRWSIPEGERARALAERPLLVLLHGYGSHADDLFGLVPHLPSSFVVAAIEGLEPAGPGWAWFPLSADPVTGELIRDPNQAEAATGSLVAWFDALAVDYPEISSVHLLGFSQGGAMSLELLRHRPRDFDSAVVLAGFALPAESPAARLRDTALAEVRPPVFWGRDAHDPVIAPPMIEITRRWLPEHSDLTARLYSGIGHGINLDELEDVAQFLRARLAATH